MAEVMIVFVLYVFSLLIVQGIADFLLTVLSAERDAPARCHVFHHRCPRFPL
jgi:hypothetical protein